MSPASRNTPRESTRVKIALRNDGNSTLVNNQGFGLLAETVQPAPGLSRRSRKACERPAPAPVS